MGDLLALLTDGVGGVQIFRVFFNSYALRAQKKDVEWVYRSLIRGHVRHIV